LLVTRVLEDEEGGNAALEPIDAWDDDEQHTADQLIADLVGLLMKVNELDVVLGRDWTTDEASASMGGDLVRKSRPLSDPDPHTLGGQLRAARRDAGLSQGDLEMLTGIPKARLSRYENNHVAPSLKMFVRICRALGVPPGELLDAAYP
jgi:DNA-binding XRE family transcriptional regulator